MMNCAAPSHDACSDTSTGTNESACRSLGGSTVESSWPGSRAPPGSLPCYSFGGPLRDCQDVLLARKVAEACRQPHEVIRVGKEFLSRFDRYAERTVYLTDGCTSVANAADLYVNEQARQIAPVRMTGNYGGEVLRRVRAFKPVEPLRQLFNQGLLSHIGRAHKTYAELIACHPLTFAAFRQAPWHHHGLLALEQSQVTLRSPYLDNELVRLLYRGPEAAIFERSYQPAAGRRWEFGAGPDPDGPRSWRCGRAYCFPLVPANLAIFCQSRVRVRRRDATEPRAVQLPSLTTSPRPTVPRTKQVHAFSHLVPRCPL